MIKLRHYFIVIAFALALFIWGCCSDFSISGVLYNDNSNFAAAIIASDYILILYSFVAFIAILLFIMAVPKHKGWKTWLPITVAVLFFGLMSYMYFDDLKELGGTKDFAGTSDLVLYGETGMWIHNGVIYFLMLVGAYAIYHFFFRNANKNTMLRASSIICVVIFIDLCASVAFKYLWSRPRPWYVYSGMGGLSPEEIFRNLWQPQPFKAFHPENGITSSWLKSFPSGHTERAVISAGALISLSSLLPKFNNERSRTVFLYFSLIYGIVTGLLRVCAGAHFMGDVSFGIILGATLIYFGNWISYKYHLIEFSELPASQN